MTPQTGHPPADKQTQQLEQLQSEVAAKDEAYKRVLADYRNLEQRMAAQAHTVREQACTQLMTRLLPSVDHLTLMAEHSQDAALQMIVRDLTKVLEQSGLQSLAVKPGDAFDPHTMEATEAVPGEPDTVVAVAQQGYRVHEAIIRHAKVSVGNGQTTQA